MRRGVLPLVQAGVRLLSCGQRSDKLLRVEKRKIPTPNGCVKALWYEPKNADGRTPCILFCHGGGFVLPAAPYHYRLARMYAAALGCKVLFVQYRLSPKHVFPAPMEDCYAAYEWLLENAETLGIDERRIAVCGDSAGGALATVVAMKARDNGVQTPCGQLLIYPVVGGSLQTPSMLEYTDTPMCNSRDMVKYYRLFFGADTLPDLPYVSPLNAQSLRGMPDTYIETAEFDCLRDEGKAYAERLRSEGAEVEYHGVSGTIHGFDIVKKSGIVDECVRKRTAFLARVFAR